MAGEVNMPKKNIHIRNKEVGGEDTIVATPNGGNTMFTLGSYTLKFHNHLDVKASLTIHDFYDKNLGSELSDFCTDHPGVSIFEIPANDHIDCEPESDGFFAFMVTADEHETLDPVIIIKPDLTSISMAANPPGESPGGVEWLGLAAPLLVGLLGGFVAVGVVKLFRS